MTPYRLFTLCLRLLGFWVVLSHADDLMYSVFRFYGYPRRLPTWSDDGVLREMFCLCASSVVVIGLGVALICLAPRIARWFYAPRESSDDPISCGNVTLAGLYRIAAFLMGIYVATLAVSPILYAVQLVINAKERVGRVIAGVVIFSVQGGVYLVCGAVLVFGAPAVGRALSRLAHGELRRKSADDADGLPAPQFTWRVALVIVAIVAVVACILVWLDLCLNK
jgi:hypothetical protein